MEKTLNGVRYTTTRQLDTFAQLQLARKLGPAVPIVSGLVDPANAGKDKSILSVLLLAQLSDEDCMQVVRTCLTTVARWSTEGKPEALMSRDGMLMFDTLKLAELLELTVAVVDENVGDFFRTALVNMAATKVPGQA